MGSEGHARPNTELAVNNVTWKTITSLWSWSMLIILWALPEIYGLPVDFLELLKLNGNPETAINSSFSIGALAQVHPYLLSSSPEITISVIGQHRSHWTRFCLLALSQDGCSTGCFCGCSTCLPWIPYVIIISFSIETFNCFIESHCYYTLDGQSSPDLWDSIAGLYPTKDKSFVRIHTNLPQ